jgi:DNA-binding transcriptional LysR family regulator
VAYQWPGVELRHLIALDAVAREGSFRGAGTRLGYVQSAVSQQIASLEAAVGETLVVRSRGSRRIAMTEAGELLLQHSGAIVARLRAAQADLAALARGAKTLLDVGSFETVSARIMPNALRRLAQRSPETQILLHDAVTDLGHLALVERGELDLAFVDLPLPDGPFEAEELVADPWIVLAPAGSPVAALDRLTLSDLSSLSLIGHASMRPSVEDRLRSAGVDAQLTYRSDLSSTVQALVAGGLGAALIPSLSVDASDPRTVIRPLDPAVPLAPRRIGIAWHAQRRLRAPALAFVEAARAACRQYQASAAA